MTDTIDTCLVCGKEIPPGPDSCGSECEATYRDQKSRNYKLNFEQRQEVSSILEQLSNEDYISTVLHRFIFERDEMKEVLRDVLEVVEYGRSHTAPHFKHFVLGRYGTFTHASITKASDLIRKKQ